MVILIIRHGETDLNAARVIQHPDTPLSKRGMQQVEQLGRHLATRRIDLVLTSDYTRAHMTAQRVANQSNAPIEINTNLRERNFGDVRGTAYAELGGIDITAEHYEPPAGETGETFHARVDLAWEEVTTIADRLDGDLAVVTHGLVVASLVDRVLDGATHFPEAKLVVANTSVTIVEPVHPWRILELANVDHLPDPRTAGGFV